MIKLLRNISLGLLVCLCSKQVAFAGEGMRSGLVRQSVTSQPLVVIPYEAVRGGMIERYKIGQYPTDDNARYKPPSGFIRVDAENVDTRVSNHFTLGQFLCKQRSGWPKFVVLDHRLLIVLEATIELLATTVPRQDKPVMLKALHIMSGYRTPAYNKSLGNVARSRHIYGDAADVFVDADNNGVMDDLNADGVSDIADAHWMIKLIENAPPGSALFSFRGGLSAYAANEYHGPFVHIDARGTHARWTQPDPRRL